MSIKNGLMVLILSLYGIHSTAQAETFKVDMGFVRLKVVDAKSTEKICYAFPDDCQGTTLSIQRFRDSVLISHKGEPCRSGAKIVIPVRLDESTVIDLGAGVAEVDRVSEAMRRVSEIRLVAETGLIRSSIVPSSRINKYKGQRGSLRTKNGKGPSLSINVKTGSINFD